MTKFPPHDKQAWEQGDISTAALGVFIGKIVSHDLSALAPRLVGFLDNIAIDIDTINSMMLDQKTSGSCVFTKCCSREVLQTHVLFNASEYFMYSLYSGATPRFRGWLPGDDWEPTMCRWLQNNPQIWQLARLTLTDRE